MSDETNSWKNTIEHLFWMTKTYETMPAGALALKLSEEVGEFSEIMLHELGYLRHKDKEWKDTPIEEAADIINILIGTLAMHYPDKSAGQLSDDLYAAVKKKGAKYARIIGADKDLVI